MQLDMRVMELLASKLCHDLISPVSAINNGVELIDDIGGSVVEEAMKLIGDSAGHASRRLRLFRVAYGRAGSEEGLSLRDVKQIAQQYVAGGKLVMSWPDDTVMADIANQRGFLKLVLNLIILSEEILAYGGSLALRSVTNDSDHGWRFEIVGRNAQLSAITRDALAGATPIDDLTPRSIQAYITGRYVEQFGLSLKFDQTLPDRLDISLLTEAVSNAA